ncbi:NAD(P)/FAD-dependent oxidoreductase [Candidatus Binatus sp.]|jgi:flavin-dependent dehydrogenase|uniref:NAD(P)/FAD-dependent oxidoreductase n=1 Tax=Candidatus Binatus sp. TaxID=2811406 RepID=UPI003CB7AD8E
MSESAKAFDAIIVGARVAGSAAAILLARDGRRVLLVDKDAFPSERLSTHIVLGGGTKVLERMGVLETLERLGGVRFSKMRSIGPDFDYSGALARDGADDRGLCLGRVLMDAAMIDAARSFEGVTFRERLRLTDLIIEDGAVMGIRGEDASGVHEFHAPLTIGADGMRSSVAQIASERIDAFQRTDVPCARAYYYAYFDGVARKNLGDEVVTEFESAPGAGNLVCRCENGLTVAATAFDAGEMKTFRTDLVSNLRRYLNRSFEVGKMLEGATMVGKVFSSGLLNNTYRDPVTDGALLLGDAGLHVDPLFGQGHSMALMSASIVGELAPQWFSTIGGKSIWSAMLAEFTKRRDAELMPYYRASVRASQELGLDQGARFAHRAASREQWAADEMIRFAQMITPRAAFPSFRFARLMAAASRAA